MGCLTSKLVQILTKKNPDPNNIGKPNSEGESDPNPKTNEEEVQSKTDAESAKSSNWKSIGKVLRIWPLFHSNKPQSVPDGEKKSKDWKQVNKSIIKIRMLGRFFGIKSDVPKTTQTQGKWMSKNKSIMLIRKLNFGFGKKPPPRQIDKWKRVNKSIIKVNIFSRLFTKKPPESAVLKKKWVKSTRRTITINILGGGIRKVSPEDGSEDKQGEGQSKPEVTFQLPKPGNTDNGKGIPEKTNTKSFILSFGFIAKIISLFIRSKVKRRIEPNPTIPSYAYAKAEQRVLSPNPDPNHITNMNFGTTIRVATAIARMGRRTHQMSAIFEDETKEDFSRRGSEDYNTISNERNQRKRSSIKSVASLRGITSSSESRRSSSNAPDPNSPTTATEEPSILSRSPSISQPLKRNSVRNSIGLISGADTFGRMSRKASESNPQSRINSNSGDSAQSGGEIPEMQEGADEDVFEEDSGMNVNVAMKVSKAIHQFRPKSESEFSGEEENGFKEENPYESQIRELKAEMGQVLKMIREADEIKKKSKKEWDKLMPIYKKAWESTEVPICVLDLIRSVRYNPPKTISLVLEAICVLKGIQPDVTYRGLRKEVLEVDYRRAVQKLLVANLPDELYDLRNSDQISLVNIAEFQERIMRNPDFSRAKIIHAFPPAGVLFDWLLRVERYAKISLEMEEVKRMKQIANSLRKQGKITLKQLRLDISELETK